MGIAVIGHVEWAEFALVDQVPEQGDIVHANKTWEQPAGGGAVAAVQISKLAGDCLFLTAVGGDARGDQVLPALSELGLQVRAARRDSDQRRAFVYLDSEGERTITTIGQRVGPRVADDLPWDELNGAEAVYVTAADAEALRAARTADIVVATVRVGSALAESGIQIDALVASQNDKGEQYHRGEIGSAPRWVVRTDGASGGTLEDEDGVVTTWRSSAVSGAKGDAYGAGDSFAGGLTYGLGRGFPIEKAIAAGAFCGAFAVRGHGPYAGQADHSEFLEWEKTAGASP